MSSHEATNQNRQDYSFIKEGLTGTFVDKDGNSDFTAEQIYRFFRAISLIKNNNVILDNHNDRFPQSEVVMLNNEIKRDSIIIAEIYISFERIEGVWKATIFADYISTNHPKLLFMRSGLTGDKGDIVLKDNENVSSSKYSSQFHFEPNDNESE